MINLRLSVEGGNEMSELKIPAGISEIRKDGYYYIDKSEISEQIREIMATTVLVMGLCLAVALIMMSVISKILSTRILQLKHGAEEISRGNFELKIEQGYSDEIGVVAESFREMCMKINQMMQDMYQLGLEKRKEELKALQAMMNPHFLYNCLSSIKWKAIRSDQDDIAEITGLLATFYRTALNGGRQITIVQNELENIKAYLQIQLKSHENNFDVEYQLDEAGGECQMPNFLLQPIVENAICHGADLCESERGKIQPSAEKSAEGIYKRVFSRLNPYCLQWPDQSAFAASLPVSWRLSHRQSDRLRCCRSCQQHMLLDTSTVRR